MTHSETTVGIQLKPSARRVLAELRRGPQTTHDLMQADVGGVRFGARLRELREAGFVISEGRLPLPTRGSRYELTHDIELPKPSGERPTGRDRRRDDPCQGVAAPSQTGTDRPPVMGSLFNADEFQQDQASYRDAA